VLAKQLLRRAALMIEFVIAHIGAKGGDWDDVKYASYQLLQELEPAKRTLPLLL
jgi:hypothetical protein